MKANPELATRWARHYSACAGATVVVSAMLVSGCASAPPRMNDASNPSLRMIESPSGASQIDSDRVKLARFIGVWSFQGTVEDESGSSRGVSGNAAGVLESGQFVLLDVQATNGEFAGRSGRKSGSLLLGGEPGKGLTVTAWGDGSPQVRRLVGATNADGSVFEFRQVHGGPERVTLRIAFETDDRWIATITRSTGTARAVYTFTRSE